MKTSLEHIVQCLSGKVPSPRLEARMILAHVLQVEPEDLSLGEVELSASSAQTLDILISQRLQHYPLDKLLGYKDFYKYRFIVSEDVLSPRPDTEILVEEAARLLQHNPSIQTLLDLGTGSGCIILSLLADFPQVCGCGVDCSLASLKIAEQNAQALGVSSRIRFKQLDWFSADFITQLGGNFPLIVSNPPYITRSEIAGLEPEVRSHDPYGALSGGEDGLDSYRRLAELSPQLLKQDGYILLESGAGQDAAIVDLFTEQGLIHIRTIPDLSGINRCVVFQKSS